MLTRFLHTSDWQLGVTRHFLDAESQGRWASARFEAIRSLGRIAADKGCEFIVVAGDIFESNQVDQRTITKACDAIASLPVPTYLLPANHDPLDAGSVFLSRHWRERKPGHAHVLDVSSQPVQVCPGVEVVGAPWTSRRPLKDLIAAAGAALKPIPGVLRVMVGHGAVDELSPNRDDPAAIRIADAEKFIAEGRFHYLALGDRHSYTKVGASSRIFYSGTHEAYDFDEVDPGKVLVVDLTDDSLTVTPHQNGAWRFVVHTADVSTAEDVEALARYLEAMPGKDRTMLKLGLVGTLTIRLHERLEQVEQHARDLFAAVLRSTSRSELVVTPDNTDFDQLSLTGFATAALSKLRSQAEAPGPGQEAANDALALMVRIAGRSS